MKYNAEITNKKLTKRTDNIRKNIRDSDDKLKIFEQDSKRAVDQSNKQIEDHKIILNSALKPINAIKGAASQTSIQASKNLEFLRIAANEIQEITKPLSFERSSIEIPTNAAYQENSNQILRALDILKENPYNIDAQNQLKNELTRWKEFELEDTIF